MRPHQHLINISLRLTLSTWQHKKIALLLLVPYNYICVSLIRQYCVVAGLPSLPQGAPTLCGGTPYHP